MSKSLSLRLFFASNISEKANMKKAFFHPLDDLGIEVIFAPFHDPFLASQLPFIFKKGKRTSAKIEFEWCWTKITWDRCKKNAFVCTLSAQVFRNIQNYTHFIACLNAPFNVSYKFSADFGTGHVSISEEFTGTSSRDEKIIPITISKNIDTRFLNYFTVKINANSAGPGQVTLSWFGLRDSPRYRQLRHKKKNKEMLQWDNFIYPQNQWGKVAFAKGLLFDESALDGIRRKKRRRGWKQHFNILESQAKKYLQRIPEADLGAYLPTDDQRYIRDSEKGKRSYHWEALVLAFVGLVVRNKQMIQHALRYMMCMALTPNWAQSAEQRIRSSTWDIRCFMEEMTTTSLSILLDWLDFALLPATKNWIRQIIWDRGISFVRRDLMKNAYMRHMNQGAVFSRACILGGLMLEDHWDMGDFVDDSFNIMEQVLKKYIQSDGSVHEGPAYLCQLMQGTIPAMIAYHRARKTDYTLCIRNHFGKTIAFIETLSAGTPGMLVPWGDCRTHWFCGDGIPVLAALFPDTLVADMLGPCLQTGQVFKVTGTLTGSGGLLGMAYGPSKVAPSSRIRQGFSVLQHSGLLSCKRSKNDHQVSLFINGSPGRQTHAHKDCGAFVLSVNDVPLFIDRGMLEYHFIGALDLTKSSMHNLLTPILHGGIFPDHSFPDMPIKPKYCYNAGKLNASFDLTAIWSDFFARYRRHFESKSPEKLRISEEGRLKKKGRLAFHLHTPHNVSIKNNIATIYTQNTKCSVRAKWVSHVKLFHDRLHLNQQKTTHIAFLSKALDSHFRLDTDIQIAVAQEKGSEFF
jgi:hypothetical protein